MLSLKIYATQILAKLSINFLAPELKELLVYYRLKPQTDLFRLRLHSPRVRAEEAGRGGPVQTHFEHSSLAFLSLLLQFLELLVFFVLLEELLPLLTQNHFHWL